MLARPGQDSFKFQFNSGSRLQGLQNSQMGQYLQRLGLPNKQQVLNWGMMKLC